MNLKEQTVPLDLFIHGAEIKMQVAEKRKLKTLLKAKELKQILSIHSKPVLRNDNTIRHENKFYQILGEWKGVRPDHVVIQERIDGKLYLVHEGKNLAYRQIQEPPKRVQTAPKKMLLKIKPPIPGMSHPWKGPSFRRMQVEKAKVAA